MKKIQNLADLLTKHLRQIYYSEQVLEKELPGLRQKAISVTLRSTINKYGQKKTKNLDRLKQCMDLLQLTHKGHKCAITDALLQDCQISTALSSEKYVVDAALISSLQQINHFNIARYGTAAAHARTLGKENIASLLHNALREEKNMDTQLSEIAEENINAAAVMAV